MEEKELEKVEAEEAQDQEENEEEKEAPLPSHVGSGKRVRISGPLLYENSFIITQEVYQEFLKALTGRYRRVYYVVGAASLIMGVFSLFGGAGASSLLFFVIPVLCIFLSVNTYRYSIKQKYAQQVEKNGGKPPERRVLFYMSGLELYSSNGAHSVIRYGDITKIISSKSMYILVIKNLSLLVLKDSFTKGTLEECKTFMNKKGLWKIK